MFDTGGDGGEPIEPLILERGGTLSRYLLVERVGIGGMGVVWAAYDPELDRKVAIKLLRPRRHGGRSELARSRLIREAQAMARLNHPNVMAVHDVGEHGGQVFLAMEFVHGKTLGEWVRATRRDWPEIVAMYVQAGRGLAEAHRCGLVHRDFKPANVLVGSDARARVTDFGLARSVETLSGEEALGLGSQWSVARVQQVDPTASALASHLTQTGSMLGTPAYMAPEQFESGQFDARSDQFAFCVALWEALHRQRPFAGETIAELSDAVSDGTIVAPPSDSRIPGALDRTLRRGLAVDPDARWPSMDALLTELGRKPASARWRWLVAAGVVASFTAALIVAPHLLPDPITSGDGCPDSSAELDGVWDASRREALAAAVLAAGGEGQVERLEQITAALDDYGSRWSAMHQDICEHRRPYVAPGLSAARTRCLVAGRWALAASVDRLVDGGVEVFDRAGLLIELLPAIEACGRSRYLDASVPLPADPERAHAIESLRWRFAAAKLRAEFGDSSAGLAELRALVDAAGTLGFPPLGVELNTELGELEVRIDDPLTAPEQTRERLEQAVADAIRTRQDVHAARAATALIEIVGWRVAEPDTDEALRWAARARAWHERVDAPAINRATADVAEGVVRQRAGDDDGAERSYFAALEHFALRFDRVVVSSRANEGLAQLRLARGDLRGARAMLDGIVELRAKWFGEGDRETVRIAVALAAVDVELGDWGPALAGLERVANGRAGAGAALELAKLRLARAELLGSGLAEVEALVRDAVAAPGSQRRKAEALLVAAWLERAAGRLGEAEALLDSGAALLEGEPDGELAIAYALERGWQSLAGGQAERALDEFVGVAELLGVARSSVAAEAHAGQGRALVELGRLLDARVELEAALAIWDELAPKGHPRAVFSLELLAGLAGPESRYRSRAEVIRAGL